MAPARWRPTVRVTLVAAVAVAGCTSADGSRTAAGPIASTGSVSGPSSSPPSTPSATATAPAAPARLSLVPNGSTNVSPIAPVVVGVAPGRLASVRLVNASGRQVAGILAGDKTSWKVAEPLGYGTRYTLSASAVNAAGRKIHETTSFTTLTPHRQVTPFFDNPALLAIKDNATYGVGMVVNVHWGRPIPDRRAAERTLAVTTSAAVTGSWCWVDDQDVHWRPQHYYKAGTKVTVAANDYGHDLGAGIYGRQSKTVHFTIGASRVSVADDRTHHVRVYQNGRLVRDMPTSMGRGGSQRIMGRTISYWTPPGTYTVVGHANPQLMDSTTYGLPLSQGGYREYIYYATRISTGGIFLHQMASTVADQGHRDVSHGCLNLSPANARWFYRFAQLGDVVMVEHTGGAALPIWQGGDWSTPWTEWGKGSALS